MSDPTQTTAHTPSPPTVLTLGPTEGPASHLAVMLHGVGASAASFHDVARLLSRTLPRVAWVTPDGFHPFDQGAEGRQWFSVRGVTEANRAARVRAAGQEVSPWIDAQLEAYGVPADKLVIVGFSQGAIVAGWLAVHRSPPPAAVVMLSGRFADDASPVADAIATPILIAHGSVDPVVPVSVVEPSARALRAWGAKVTAHVYPGLGHGIDARTVRDVEAFLDTALHAR